MHFLYWGTQNCLQDSTCDLTSTVERSIIILPGHLNVLLLLQPWLLLVFAARTHLWLMPSLPATSTSPSPSQQSCSPNSQAPACIIVGGISFPRASFGIYPSWISRGSCWPIHPASYTLLNSRDYQVVLSLWCHLETCWACTP